MNKKIVIALTTVLVLVVCLVAFVGCQPAATISLSNEGALVLEVNQTVDLPLTVTGELKDNQVIDYTIELGNNSVIRFDKDTLKVTGLKEGYAIMRIKLDSVSLPLEIVVNPDSAAVKAYTDALAAAKDQITSLTVPAAVTGYSDAAYVAELTQEYENLQQIWIKYVEMGTSTEDIALMSAQAVKSLNDAVTVMTRKIEGLNSLDSVDFTANAEPFEGLNPDLLAVALSNPDYVEFTKDGGIFYTLNSAAIKTAETVYEIEDAIRAALNSYISATNAIVYQVMFAQIGLDVQAGDDNILDKLEELRVRLDNTDNEFARQLNEVIETIKLMKEVEMLNVAGGTYYYNASYHTFDNLSGCVIDYSVNGNDWLELGNGIKDAGNYTIRATKTVDITYGGQTVQIECVAYGKLSILKATLPTPIWPTVDPSGFVIYTKLNDIPLVGGLPGEGSPYDDEHVFGGRVNGIFRWYEGEREIDPVNFGYAVEFVPVVCDSMGQPVLDANGGYIFDTNFEILRQIVEVPVKNAYVVVTPLDNQWKNYDGTTATGIEYDFRVYTDSTKTVEVSVTAKLRDYVLNNLTGALVLEDDSLTSVVEPARDSGHWYIEQGTLALVPGAKLNMEYSNPGITYEIKPLTISAVNSLVVEKVYDGTVNAPDKEYVFTDYTLVDSEGYPVSLVSGDELKAYITGATFDNKNVGTNKVVSFNSANVTLTEDGAALRNYVVTPETYSNISITGTITKRPITRLTGRIETRQYDGTDIAYYQTEDTAQRLVMVQGVDSTTGVLLNAEYNIETIEFIRNDDISIELLNNGRYVGNDVIGTRGKDIGYNKSILFANTAETTAWTLVGADAGNYEYVGALSDVDPDKASKVTYLGDIIALVANGNVELAGLEAIKVYDANDICYISNLERNSDGTVKSTLTFTSGSASTIRNDVITIDNVISNGLYTLDDYVTGISSVGDHKVAFDISAFVLGGDAINYDWSGYVVKGIGTITPITVEFDTTALARINERTYDATNIAYTLPSAGGEGGLQNFGIYAEDILTGVRFTNLIQDEEFYIRILKDGRGNFYNGAFADKNVGVNKTALWAGGTWELVEVPGNSGKIENYVFNTVDMPAIGDIIQKRITTVKFEIESRIYDATDVAYIENVIGTDTLDSNGGILETLIDANRANLIIEEMCAGDILNVIIKGDGTYSAGKNASAEKEALFTLWDIVGADANNYRFGAAIEPYETTPTTTVLGIGAVTQKNIDSITIKNYTVTKRYDGSARANFAQLNTDIASGNAVVEFEGMFAGDNLRIEITAYGEFGTFVNNVWTATAEVGSGYMVKYTRKTTSGDDRNNYYVDATDIYVESGEIL